MNIPTEKLQIIKMILETGDARLLESVSELLKKDLKTQSPKILPKDHKEDFLMGIDTDEAEDFDEFIKKYG